MQIQQVLKSIPSVTGATLYGSRAREDYRVGSDIDISLIGDAITYADLLKAYTELDDLMLPYSFDLSIFSRIGNQLLKQNIIREGQQLCLD